MITITVIPLNKFVYGGDASTLGNRWTDWEDFFYWLKELARASIIKIDKNKI